MVFHRNLLRASDKCADGPVAVTRSRGSSNGNERWLQDPTTETSAARDLADYLPGREVPGVDKRVQRTCVGIAIVDDWTDRNLEVVANAATRRPCSFPPWLLARLAGTL